MRVLITQKINGVQTTTDYTHYVVDGSLTVEDSVNVPTLTSFQLANVDNAFVVPKRSAYVQVLSEIYSAGGGYIKNTAPSTNYTIQGTDYPWSPTDPNFPFVTSGGSAAQSVPVLPNQQYIITYVSGTVTYESGHPAVTPIGAPGVIPPSPQLFPGVYIGPNVAPYCLIGAFANAAGNLVGDPFYIGVGPITVGPAPSGATQLLMGMNDWPYNDNTGSWIINVSQLNTGLALATGFITTEPERTYLGLSNKVGGAAFNNHVYTYNILVSSDEWLLNCQAVPYIPAFVNQTDSQILANIAEALMPGFFNTSAMASGNLVPYYAYDPSQTWSEIAKTFADQFRYHYKVINKTILYEPFGDEALGIAYDDQNQKEGYLAPLELTTSLVTVPPINDCIVLGAVEPQTNWANYFCGDGFTSNFQLRHQVFEGTSANLLEDDWTESSFTQGTWTINDPAGIFILADGNGNALGALNVVQKGQTGVYQPQVDAEFIQAQNGIELGGGINLQHGSFTFNDTASGGGGIVGGIYGTSTFTPGTCLAGFGITGQPNIGTFTVVSVQIVTADTQQVNLTINGTAPTNLQAGNVFTCASFVGASFLNGTTQTVVSVSQISSTQFQIIAQGSFVYNNPYGPTTDSGSITFASNAVFVTASGAAGIVIQPIYNGQYVGQPVVTQVNHQYLLQTWIGAGAQTRYTLPYTNLTQTSTYGAQNLAASGTITWVITDVFLGNYVIEEQNPLFGLFPSAPPPVVTQYSQFNVNLPPFALYCLVNAVDLNCSINYTLLSYPPQGYLTVQSLTGMSGGNLPWLPSQLSPPIVYQLGFGQDNQTAQISNQGEAFSLAFYTDDIPSVGARIVFQSWSAGQSVARVQDPIAIANEASISGDSGIRSAILTNVSPQPLTSADCEAAAAASILDNEYPQFQGTYTIQTIPYKFENLLAPSIYGYPMTGRFLYVNSPVRAVTGQNFYVNTVRTQVLELKQEVLTISLDYGMDTYLEKLLPAFLASTISSTILTPTQTVPPPNPITLSQVLNATLPTLDNAIITSITNSVTGNYITVNIGTVPVTGCEVRNVDSGWGVADNGRVGLFTTSVFTLPRTSRDQTWYLRTINGSIFSRFSKALRVVYPLVPSAPTLVSSNSDAIVFDYAGDVRDIYGLELRAAPVSGVEFVEFPDVPEDQFAQLTRSSLVVPTDPAQLGQHVKNSGNVFGIYNPPSNSVPFPFPEQFELGDVIYVVCPSDGSFQGVELVTNVYTATGNSGVQIPPGVTFANAVAFFATNPNNFNGAFAYSHPFNASVAANGQTLGPVVSLTSLEFNYGPGVNNFYDPNTQPVRLNMYSTGGSFLGTTFPWTGATQGWAMAITGNLVFGAPGTYTFGLEHDDGAMFAVGSEATVSSPKTPLVNNSFPNSAVLNIPYICGDNNSGYYGNGNSKLDYFNLVVPSAGEVQFEINYAQWYNAQTLALTCPNGYNDHIFPGTVVTASSGAPWGIGWFDYGEPYIDIVGNGSFGVNSDIATVQLYNRGPFSTCASGAISGNYTGVCTVWTTTPHGFSPGQQVIVGAGWQTFPQTGYPALPNSGSVLCGLQFVTNVLGPNVYQFTSSILSNPSGLQSGSSAQVIAQLGVTPQYLNGLCAAMPTPFNLPASSGVIIQRPVFAPSDLVIDLTQPDIQETFGIIQALSPGGRIQGLTAYFFNLTWDYSNGTPIPSVNVPSITGVFINELTQQVSWNLQQGIPSGYRVDITDPVTNQLYNQFTIDHPYNPVLLTQFQMSNYDFGQNRNVTITPFDIAGDGVPITIYHPAGTVQTGGGGGTGSGLNVAYGCTWQGNLSPASGILLHVPAALGIGPVTMLAGLSGCNGRLNIAPAGTVVLPILRNGVQFGTMTFLPGQNFATFYSATTQVFNPSTDYLTVLLPGTADSLASDLGFVITGYIGYP